MASFNWCINIRIAALLVVAALIAFGVIISGINSGTINPSALPILSGLHNIPRTTIFLALAIIVFIFGGGLCRKLRLPYKYAAILGCILLGLAIPELGAIFIMIIGMYFIFKAMRR